MRIKHAFFLSNYLEIDTKDKACFLPRESGNMGQRLLMASRIIQKEASRIKNAFSVSGGIHNRTARLLQKAFLPQEIFRLRQQRYIPTSGFNVSGSKKYSMLSQDIGREWI